MPHSLDDFKQGILDLEVPKGYRYSDLQLCERIGIDDIRLKIYKDPRYAHDCFLQLVTSDGKVLEQSDNRPDNAFLQMYIKLSSPEYEVQPGIAISRGEDSKSKWIRVTKTY